MDNVPANRTDRTDNDSTTRAELENETKHLLHINICFCVIVFLAGVVLYLLRQGNNSTAGESTFVTCLFMIPFVVQLPGTWALHQQWVQVRQTDGEIRALTGWVAHIYKFCRLWMFVVLGSYGLLWVMYSWPYFERFQRSLSYLALALIFVVLWPVLRMTVAIMKPNPKKTNSNGNRENGQSCAGEKGHRISLENLKNAAIGAPLLTLLFFFTLFLAVAYLFSFALAFHDRYELRTKGSPALLIVRQNNDPVPSKVPASKIIGSDYWFFFDLASAKVSSKYHEVRKFNRHSLARMKHDLQASVQKGAPVEVLLKGSADDGKVNETTNFSSNYELSDARIQSVRDLIKQVLQGEDTDRHIAWTELAFSNELPRNALPPPGTVPLVSTPSTTNRDNPNKGLDRRAVVASMRAIQHESFDKDTSLLDYIYFTIYTITTTGYGDIIPKTPYAKFLCSLANIFEVFFLVVFFNALLTLRKSHDEMPT